MARYFFKLVALAFAMLSSTTLAFTVSSPSKSASPTNSVSLNYDTNEGVVSLNRRGFIEQMTLVATSTTFLSQPVSAEDKVPEVDKSEIVKSALYYILRVREATQQETRLIKSGKFKDVQRANVKLAVKFMLENYKLSDNFIKASAFLSGNKKIAAVNAGQECIQNLQTITEYFDSGDVENIKVGSSGMSGKESLVLNGLDASRKNIDVYLSYFDTADVAAVQSKIDAENELNEKEFDTALGNILNAAPKP